jgi:LPXTG-site transpeptidase (sortase) family protein
MRKSLLRTKYVIHIAVLLLILIIQFSFAPTRVVQAQTVSLPAQINKSFTPISIPAGGTSTLSISIFNPNSFALTLSATPPAWTDDLSTASLNFASPAATTTTCGGIVTTVGTTLSLIGGSVPAQVGTTPGSCTVTVNVTSIIPGNHVNTMPASVLNATDPTGTTPVTNTTPASATLQVNAVQPPSLSKTFAPNTIWVGQTSVLTITVRNTDTSASLTQTSLTDNLPTNIMLATPPSPTLSGCGGSASVTDPGGNPLAGGGTSVTLNNASIAASGTCTIKVNVSSLTPGIYTNTIPANAIHTQQGVTNVSAASAPLNVQAIGIKKSFSPSNFQSGGTSTLTITLQNPSSSAFTGAAFIDTLPAGLTVASAPASPQCGGTVTSTTSSIQLSGGTIPAGSISTPGTCTITATVTSTTAASYTNSIPPNALTTDQGARNVLAANANVTVYATGLGVSGSKGFNPSTIPVGGTSRMTFNITAPADTQLTNFSLSDALPSGVQVAGTPNPTKNANCVGSTFAPAAGDTLITYTGGTIPIGSTCSLAVNVTSSTPGVFSNVISPANISDNQNRNLAGNISANLTVSGLSVSKAFAPNTVNPEGISTLTITLTNSNDVQLDNVSLNSDTLPGNTTNGILIAPTPNISTTCTGGGSVVPTLTADAGTQVISMGVGPGAIGGIIPAEVAGVPGICTITVDVIGKGRQTTYTNTIAANRVSGTIHGTSTVITNPQQATANIRILAITIGVVKGFDPLTVFAGSASTLTVQLSNPNSVALAGIAFSDDLPQGTGGGMSIANPPNPDVGTCGGSISAIPGNTSFSFSGGSLAASASCSLTLSVTMNVEANLTNNIGIGAVTSSNGATNTQAASATLTNLPGVSLSKVFGTNPILAGTGNSSTLTFTIQNTGNVDLTHLGFSDTFPTGMTATTFNASQCGGTVSWESGTNVLTLADGALAGLTTCTITVDVTAPAPKNYQNCVPANSLSNDQLATNQTDACDTLRVIAPPTISKAFSPTSIAAGVTSVLTFTLTNPVGNAVTLTGVAFTDTFPSGLTIASTPNVAQCNGTVSWDDPSKTLSLKGGSIPVSGNCTVTVSVTAAAGGSYANTSGAVTSMNGGTGNTASATLTVIAPPSISKVFAPDPIAAGDTSTLTFTLTNPNASIILTGVGFTDALPLGMQVAAAPNASTSGCDASSTPVFAPTAGSTSLLLSAGSIAGGGMCALNVDVTASGGNKVNTSSAVTSTNGGTGNTATATLDVTGGGLSLAKSTSTVGYQAAGDIINYSYLLTNTGDITLYAPFNITDDHIGSPTGTQFSCGSAATLVPLGSVTCTADYTVTAADLTSKSVTNMATATAMDASSGGNIVTSNQSSVTVRLESLTLTKSTTTTSYRTAGDTIAYNYTLTNTGSVTLYAPFSVTDNRIGSSFTCGSATSLAPGANVTCSRTYTVLALDVTAGFVTNTAKATAYDAATGGNQVTSSLKSVTVYAVIAPTISKAFSPATIAVGETSTLTFTITNPSPNAIPLTGIGFTDNLPADLTVSIAPDAAQCGGNVTSTTTSVTLSGGTVVPNSTCTVTVSVTSAVSGVMNNTSGAVSSTNGGTGNTASATLTVVAPPSISKSFAPTAIIEGGTSTLTFTLTAPAGNSVSLTGVGFTDDLPTGLQVANPPNSSTSNCGTPAFSPAAGNTILSFSGGTIAPGGNCTVTVDVTATSFGSFNNTSNPVTSSNGGNGAISNTATLTVEQALDLSITKSDGKLSVNRDEAVNYTIVVRNAGPSDASGATVFDTIPSSLTGATWTCSAVSPATCTAGGSGNISDTVDIPAGSSITYTVSGTVAGTVTTDILNRASVIAPAGVTDSNSANNSASDTDTLNRLSIVKSASPATYSALTDTIHYTYTITNDGTSTLVSPFTISDNKVTPVCAATSSLAPGATISCSDDHTITQADIDAGSITNNVSATGTDADGDTITTNTDTATVTAVQTPGLTLAKSINSGSPFNAAGNVVIYSYLLTNSGNVTLTGNGPGGLFTVTDDHIGSPPGTAFTCGAATSLAPLGTTFCTASYTVSQADLDNGTVTNLARGHALFGSTPVTSAQASQTAVGAQAPSLSLVKSITSGSPYSAAGDVLNYSYLLTNTGNVTLTGIGGGVFTVTDDKAMVTCPATPTSLAPGAAVTCTASYTIVAADLGSSVTNHATGHAVFKTTTVDSNAANARAVGAPVLNITKDDGLNIIAPEAVTEYTITVTDASLQDSTGIQLVDTIPDGTSFVSATGGGTFDSGTGKITWPTFGLAAGASIQFKVQVKVKTAAELLGPPAITSLTNTVNVQDDGTHSAGTPVSGVATDTDQIATIGVKTLTGTEQAGSTDPNVLIGEIIDYSIRIDIPNGTINNLQAVDILDHGLAFVGCDPTTPVSAGSLVLASNPCTDPSALTVQAEPVTDVDLASDDAGRHITFNFGQVQNTSGTTQTLTVNYRVIALDIKDNVSGVTGLKNGVQWTWEGGTLAGAATGVNIVEPKLNILKTVSPAIASLGSVVTFTLKIDHASNSTAPAYDALLTDSIPTGLTLDETSIVVTGSAGLPASTVTTTPTQFSVYWSAFPLGETATITFNAAFIGPSPVINTANVEWSSLQIDPAPHLQPQSTYNQHSTERRYDPLDQSVNDYLATSSATLTVPRYPRTGFAPGEVTAMPAQPEDKMYQGLGNLWLEIPRLGVKESIVGVQLGLDGEWDLTWLGDQAGYLDGTAYPTHAGNSVITGHVYLSDGSPGPFVNLHTLRYGDSVIVHLDGQRYFYEVRSDTVTSPDNNSAFKHEIYPWLTLITCKDYDALTGTYSHRVTVRAVLIKIETDQPAASNGGGR